MVATLVRMKRHWSTQMAMLMTSLKIWGMRSMRQPSKILKSKLLLLKKLWLKTMMTMRLRWCIVWSFIIMLKGSWEPCIQNPWNFHKCRLTFFNDWILWTSSISPQLWIQISECGPPSSLSSGLFMSWSRVIIYLVIAFSFWRIMDICPRTQGSSGVFIEDDCYQSWFPPC